MRSFSWLAAALLFALGANAACPGQRLRDIPADPAARGPWAVGQRTLRNLTSRNLTVEIYYPAQPGSEVGKDNVVYSIRDEWLPPFQARKIPDYDNPLQPIDSYFDLPIDSAFGPYPIHIHVHGTAAWRTASAHQFVHFASRGFVVLAADHPGINLKDMLALRLTGTDQEGDARKMIDELKSLQDPQLSFLKGLIDTSKIALSGHSAGGGAISGMADVGQVLIPWCAFGVNGNPESSLILGAVEDGVARYSGQQTGYNRAAPPKRLVGVANSGHMLPTDICWIAKDLGGIVEIAKRNGIYLAYLFGPLGEDGCDEGMVKDEPAWEIVNYVNTAAQEEILYCNRQMADALRDVSIVFKDIYEYQEQLQ